MRSLSFFMLFHYKKFDVLDIKYIQCDVLDIWKYVIKLLIFLGLSFYYLSHY